ncbi:MAG TPA: hypothetical protein PLI27_08875 [Ignavibacteriales bacterium]|nr:hypothetical protein [Ignavibacteriales bacterium]HOL81420.1 hypothetical protein [Ignavibacteriales bacterium]HOM65534.1 hypothetical protein [Ignavibacteriales bacterium]HPD68171.1 hypothetical protein [Ignavibacteriales bacterium]HPP34350.1 hypothetical protein [Ignavibacteriales bacterium]
MNTTFQIDGNLSFFLIILLWLAATVSYFYLTKKNIDTLNKKAFILTIVARSLVFLLLLLIVSNTTIKIEYDKKIPPKNYIFIDDSKSMTINDGVDRIGFVKQILPKLSNDAMLFKFGESVTRFNDDLKFNQKQTNFNAIFENINTEDNISSIVIISDGCDNSNTNSIFNAQKFEIPVITVGIGNPDILDYSIEKVFAPDIAYVNERIGITVNISNNTGKAGNIQVGLFNDDVLVSTKNVTVKDVYTNVNFNISFWQAGIKNLSIRILNNDANLNNNVKKFTLNILNDYKKIVCIAGSPSNDFSFVIQALKANPKNKLSTITVIGKDRILENIDYNRVIDSSDAIVLVGFPSAETPNYLIEKLNRVLPTKSLFYILSYNVDFNKLKNLIDNLPFNYKNISNSYLEVTPFINTNLADNQIYGFNRAVWEQLPPINYNTTEFQAKDNARVILFIRSKKQQINLPLIIEQNLFSKRNLAILGCDIWKWKLLLSQKDLNIFDEFFNTAINWIAIKDDFEKLKIKLEKEEFNINENININAYLYDDSRNPIDGENLKVIIKNSRFNQTSFLTNINNGLYTFSFMPKDSGDYKITVLCDKYKLGKTVTARVSNVELELAQKNLNQKFLQELAYSANGRYFNIKNIDSLFYFLDLAIKDANVYKKAEVTVNFLSSIIPIFIIALLLGIEWFIRRRNGLL